MGLGSFQLLCIATCGGERKSEEKQTQFVDPGPSAGSCAHATVREQGAKGSSGIAGAVPFPTCMH